MYFIPFRKIFQSHSAGFHKKEDRKERALYRPHFAAPARFRAGPSAFPRASSIPLRSISLRAIALWKKKGRNRGKASSPPAPPFLLPHGTMLFHKVGWVDRLSILEYLKVQVGSFYAVIYRGLA